MRLLLLALLVMLPNCASAQPKTTLDPPQNLERWSWASGSMTSEIYIDLDTIEWNGSVATVWQWQSYVRANPAQDDIPAYERVMERINYDCDRRTVQILLSSGYHRSTIVVTSTSPGPLDPWYPESTAERIGQELCSPPPPPPQPPMPPTPPPPPRPR